MFKEYFLLKETIVFENISRLKRDALGIVIKKK